MAKYILSLIDSPKYMYKVVKSCLEKNGQNTEHSRNMILGDYRRPKHGGLSSKEDVLVSISSTVEILKHFAKKYLVDLKTHGYDFSKPLQYYYLL